MLKRIKFNKSILIKIKKFESIKKSFFMNQQFTIANINLWIANLL